MAVFFFSFKKLVINQEQSRVIKYLVVPSGLPVPSDPNQSQEIRMVGKGLLHKTDQKTFKDLIFFRCIMKIIIIAINNSWCCR